jgi:hypothetical protein
MEARYEKTRLPNHFDRDPAKDATSLSLTATAGQKEYLAFGETPQGPRFRFSNAGYGVDGSLLLEKGDYHFGVVMGLTPDPGLVRFGGFLGRTARLGPLVSSWSAGLAMNASRVDAIVKETRWETINSLWPYPVTTYDTTSGAKASAEIPLRAAVLLDVGPVSPYVAASFNYLGIGSDDTREGFFAKEASAGVQWSMRPDLRARLEGSVSTMNSDRGFGLSPRYGVRGDFEKEF